LENKGGINNYSFESNEPYDYDPDYDDIYEPDDDITYEDYQEAIVEADSYCQIEYFGYLNAILEGSVKVNQILRTMENQIVDSIGKNSYESLLFVISEEISRLTAAKKEFQDMMNLEYK
jgi:hypothetical protein